MAAARPRMAFGSHVERGAGPLDRYFYPLPGDTNIITSHPRRRISSAGTRASGGGMIGLSSSNQRRNSKNEVGTTSTSSGGEEYTYTPPTQQRISSSSRASVSTGGKTKKRYFKPAKKKSFHQLEREYYANALRERRESLSKIDTRRRSRASGSSVQPVEEQEGRKRTSSSPGDVLTEWSADEEGDYTTPTDLASRARGRAEGSARESSDGPPDFRAPGRAPTRFYRFEYDSTRNKRRNQESARGSAAMGMARAKTTPDRDIAGPGSGGSKDSVASMSAGGKFGDVSFLYTPRSAHKTAERNPRGLASLAPAGAGPGTSESEQRAPPLSSAARVLQSLDAAVPPPELLVQQPNKPIRQMDSWGLPDNMAVGAGWNGDSTEDEEPPLHLFPPPTTAPMSAAERAAGQLGTAAGFDDDFRNSLNDYESTSGGPGGPLMHDSVVDALGLGDFFAGGTKADRTSAMGRRTFPKNSAAFDIADINRNTIMAGVEQLGANKRREGASPTPGVSRRLSFDAGDEEGARFHLTAVQGQELDSVVGEDPPRFQTVISEPKDADDEADYDVDARLRETTGTASLMDYLPLQCARRKPPGGAVVRRRGRDGRMKAGYERYSAAPEAATDYDGDRNTVQLQKYVEENVAATTAKQNPGVKKSARFDQILVSPPRRGTKRSPHVPKRGSNVVSRMKSSTTGEDASGTSPKGIGSQSSQASKRDNMLKAVLGAAAASSLGGKNKKEKRKRSGSKKSGSPRGSTRPGHKSPVPLSGEDTPKKNKKAAAKKKNATRKAGGTTAEEAAGVVPQTRQNTSTAAVDAVLDAMGDFTHFYAALSPDEESNEFERRKMQQRPLKRTMSTRTYETNELWRQFEASQRPQGDQLDSQLERLADEYIQGERERMTRGPSGVDFAKVSQAFRADKRVTECFAYVGSEAKDEQGKAEHTSELHHEKSPAPGLGLEQHVDTGGASSSQQHDPEQEQAAASNAPEDDGLVSTGVLEDPDAGLAPAFGRNMNPLSAEGFLLGTLCSKNTLSRLLNFISLGACVTVLVSSYPDLLGTGPRRYTDSEVNKVLGHFGITQQEAAAAGMEKWRVATQQQHQSEAGAASAAASWTSPLAGAVVNWAQSKIAEARAITGSSLIAGRSHFFENVETMKERYEGSGGVSGAGAFFEVEGEGSHVHAKNRKGAAAEDLLYGAHTHTKSSHGRGPPGKGESTSMKPTPILHERPGSGTTQVPTRFDKDFLLHDDIANAHRASSGAPPRPAQPRRAHQRDDASGNSKGSSFDVGGFLSDMFFGTVSRIASAPTATASSAARCATRFNDWLFDSEASNFMPVGESVSKISLTAPYFGEQTQKAIWEDGIWGYVRGAFSFSRGRRGGADAPSSASAEDTAERAAAARASYAYPSSRFTVDLPDPEAYRKNSRILLGEGVLDASGGSGTLSADDVLRAKPPSGLQAADVLHTEGGAMMRSPRVDHHPSDEGAAPDLKVDRKTDAKFYNSAAKADRLLHQREVRHLEAEARRVPHPNPKEEGVGTTSSPMLRLFEGPTNRFVVEFVVEPVIAFSSDVRDEVARVLDAVFGAALGRLLLLLSVGFAFATVLTFAKLVIVEASRATQRLWSIRISRGFFSEGADHAAREAQQQQQLIELEMQERSSSSRSNMNSNNDMIRHKNNNSHLATSKRGPGAATVTFADLQQQQLDPRDIDIGEPEKVEDDNTSGGAGADMIRATSRSTEPFQDIDMETNATELKTMNSSRRREQAARPYAYSPDGGSQSASVDADALDLEPDTDSDDDLDEGMIPPVNDMRISAAMGAAELGSGAERFSSGGASMMSGVVILEDETSILTAENRASRGGFFCCS